jgi:heme exporter protein A
VAPALTDRAALGAPPAQTLAPDLTAEGLVCRRGERVVFTDLSFCLAAGGALLLTGANGSGKSSLLRLVAGLLVASAGQLLWGTTAVATDLPGHHARLHYIGHLDALKPAMTPRETLAFWAALRGQQRQRSPSTVDQALAAFALDPIADWPCRWLSTGQRRRVALARLLTTPAPLWLLDEPASALDHDSQGRLEQAIDAHRAAGGMAMLATHTPIALDGAAFLSLDAFAPRLDDLESRFDD